MKVRTMARLHAMAHSFWRKACIHDGIPYDSMFVVFSNNNPYVKAMKVARGLCDGMSIHRFI